MISARWSRGKVIGVLVLTVGLISLARMGLLNLSELGKAIGRVFAFTQAVFPPQLEVLPTLARAMLETVEIAFVGTLLGFCASLPLAFLSARQLFGPAISGLVRGLIGGIRTVPSILWGVIAVIAFGLGPAAGTIGVACYTVGYLAKLTFEAFDGVDAEVFEAVRSTGAKPLQLLRYVLLPESANTLISQLLFMFEYNIRASAIMGFVGAGGIGYYMLGYVQLLQYQRLFTALLLTFVVVMSIDALSSRLRAKVLPATTGR